MQGTVTWKMVGGNRQQEMSRILDYEEADTPSPRVCNTSWSVMIRPPWPKMAGNTFTSPKLDNDMP